MTTAPLSRSLGGYRLPIIVIAAIVSLLFFVPFVVVVATSWGSGQFIQFPPEGFSLQWYRSVLADPTWTGAFVLSLVISLLATIVALVLGIFGALAVTRIRSRTINRLVRTLFIVPMAIPPVAYALGLYSVASYLPFLQGTFVGLVVGEALLVLPYVFILVSTALGTSDPALRPAAATLGASWPLIVLRVELPPILPSIFSGAIFAFSIAFDEVVLPVFLAPIGQNTLPLKMLTASQEAFSPQLTAASTMVSLLALIVLGFVNFSTNRRLRQSKNTGKARTA
jgi:putative spermidine/putrescine transport system permease protein